MPTRRTFVQLLGATGASAVLGGCDQVSEELARLLEAVSGSGPEADFRPPASGEIDLTSHLLNRLTWGPRPGDYAHAAALGAEALIDEQLDTGRLDDRAADRRTAAIESVREPRGELYDYHPRRLLFDLTRHKILRAVYGRRQLFEIMVDFWTDHLNIVSGKGDCRWLKAADDREVIRSHALGRFRDLVRASATSPAMLIYLDGHDNKVERPGDRPNENYARELLELHTLGVHGGYTQRDVAEVARCLSGWTYENRPMRFRAARVGFDPARHDQGAKLVLGTVVPAGGGADDLERVLDIVCGHEATARHLAGKLCRRFIDPEPPDDAVAAVATAFRDSDGDIARALRALFATAAFRSCRGSLIKRPLRFLVSALRATAAETDGGRPLMEVLERMGHAPFQYPTPDGYPLDAQPWLGTLLWRWNFALALESGRLNGTRLDAPGLRRDFEGLDRLAAHLLGRAARPLELDTLRQTDHPLALALSAPAFQRH